MNNSKRKKICIGLIIGVAALVAFSFYWTSTAPHDPGKGYKASTEAANIYKYRNDKDKLGSYVAKLAQKEGMKVKVISGPFTDNSTAITFQIVSSNDTTEKQDLFVAEYSTAIMAAARFKLTSIHWLMKDGNTSLLPDAAYLKDVEGKLSKYGDSPQGIQQVIETVKEKEEQ